MFMKISLALLFLTLKAVFGIEPQCSPFHYQEQRIDKMVKLEILVQKMKDDITTLQQRVVDEIETLKEDRKLLKTEPETEKIAINNVIQQLVDNVSTLQHMVEANDDKMKKYANEVEAIKDSVVMPTTVFFAKEVTQKNLGSEAFIYKTDVLNKGKGYDITTGRFTAPVGGTYLFTVQFCMAGRGDSIYYSIVLDGTDIKRGYFGNNGDSKCYTTDVLQVLKSGAQVWVTDRGGSASLWESTNTWNTFSGVLLHK